ncbi:MAG: hypothetical protein B6D68_02045 [spirochete symbiont of Stewartia floridana]|nr:MAG: hypothetical protein B6D68_02045 [spirochete symbiont of Stewartia floridana]
MIQKWSNTGQRKFESILVIRFFTKLYILASGHLPATKLLGINLGLQSCSFSKVMDWHIFQIYLTPMCCDFQN